MNKKEIEIMETENEEKIRKLQISKESLRNMDKELIRGNNERIKNADIVYDLGDVCFRNSKGGKQGEGSLNRVDYYLNQLNGKIIIVRGNHDGNNGIKSRSHRIILYYAKMYINLIHNPEQTIISDDRYYYPLTLCSHVHTAWHVKEITNNKGQVALCVNCGVDMNNLKPVSMDEIMSIFYRWLNQRPDKKEILNLIYISNHPKVYTRP
ncbi:MAG: metallophosphoesterase [Candidatus Thorarchaeota archaeon]